MFTQYGVTVEVVLCIQVTLAKKPTTGLVEYQYNNEALHSWINSIHALPDFMLICDHD